MSRTQRLAQPEDYGKYQLIARLAHGRIGDVFKAKSHGLEGFERILALKTIDPGLAAIPSFVDVIVDEAQRAALLTHANISQVLEVGHEEGHNSVYIALEFVNGLDLRRAMDIARAAGTPWPFDLAIFIASEIANGLDYAHRRKDYNFNRLNIIHHAISPYNVMLSAEGEVKIMDFGIARALQLVQPLDDQDVLRRVLYASPEAVRNEASSQRSDLFSLGLVLYEMLTGFHPYMDANIDEVVRRAQYGIVAPITNYIQLPRPIVATLDSMLAPDPAGRASSAGQIFEELVGYIYNNHLKADARVLSVLIQDLRQDEQAFYPNEEPEEVGLEEISLSELQVPEHVQSFYGEVTMEEESIEDATRDALPRQKLQQLVMGDAQEEQSPLPGALEEYFRATRAGRGKAVLLYGSLGSGRNYFPDRLIDVLGLRGNTHVSAVQLLEDDRFRPFSALGDALALALAPPLMTEPRSATLERVRALGLSEPCLELLAGLWHLAPMPKVGIEDKQRLLSETSRRVIEELCKRSTLVLILDRMEYIDSLSMAVLRAMLSHVGNNPVMILMSTSNVEALRAELDTGNPEHLGAVKVLGTTPPRLTQIQGMNENTARAMSLLAVSRGPLSQAEMAKLLSLPGDQVISAMRQLVEMGIARVPRTGVFMNGLPELSLWVSTSQGLNKVRQLAHALLRFYTQRGQRDGLHDHTAMMVRLHAMTGDRRRMTNLANHYADWLRRSGMFPIALDFYKQAADLIVSEGLGAPNTQLEYMLERAELALDLAMVDECRASLAHLETLSKQTRNDRALLRGHILRGRMTMQQDDLDEAREHFAHAHRAAQAIQDPELLARATVAMAGWYERYGDNLGAQRMLETAMNLFDRWGTNRMDLHARALMLNRAINMWSQRKMIGPSLRFIEDLRRISQVSGLPGLDARVEWAMARIQSARGEHDACAASMMRAEQIAKRYGLNALCIEIMRQHAGTTLSARDYESTLGIVNELIEMSQRFQDVYSHQRATDMRAFAQGMIGMRHEDAITHLQMSLARAIQRNVPKDIMRSHQFLHELFKRYGRVAEAAKHKLGYEQYARKINLPSAA